MDYPSLAHQAWTLSIEQNLCTIFIFSNYPLKQILRVESKLRKQSIGFSKLEDVYTHEEREKGNK